jgi:hypothetical protein
MPPTLAPQTHHADTPAKVAKALDRNSVGQQQKKTNAAVQKIVPKKK